MTHELKIWPEYFEFVKDGRKTFEVRKDDRGFSFGDAVVLKEWDPDRPTDIRNGQIIHENPKGYTGRQLTFQIGYIFEIGDGQVVFSLLPAES